MELSCAFVSLQLLQVGPLSCSLLRHPQYDWIGASPDGVSIGGPEDEPYAVEVKCPVSREITAEVPDHYIPQVQLQLEVMDLEMCVFVQVTSAL